ncbi:dNTP triphosphohydrolase [Bradyrhizobium sp. SSUT112]|uniref:dGTP triphosphohydrolase n=1 Tax=Bradyrhizobium sp. SSUT112 TaxID=3040604 RepID=UPI00244A6C09|nr:dNTP triphosphohydrolase [Bradyrhizobium sp. SSUT112]MDH2354151.1 dNTP triphosphohydrolase [Bradyrhizobium sp. SSUT112]
MAAALYTRQADEKRVARVGKKRGDARNAYRRDVARLIHSPSFRRLQGKAQLFPSDENDFFRNRLTHSLEVAQIATGFALNLNDYEPALKHSPIDIDLVHFAALAHDLGHPPFGHDGERTLDQLMRNYGGFEGNAQTIRILTRLEKKEIETLPVVRNGEDARVGLNLTYRSIASILKYDSAIPLRRGAASRVTKGYYQTEASLVADIKSRIGPRCTPGEFKTIECSIMDLADDIAYSTYDLEDAFKADFLSPLSMAAADNRLKQRIADVVNEKMLKSYPKEISAREALTVDGIDRIIFTMMKDLFQPSQRLVERAQTTNMTDSELSYALSAEVSAGSKTLQEEGRLRSEFTSKLVYAFMSDIEFVLNSKIPALSSVRLKLGTFQSIEVLKRFAYEALVMSNRFKMADRRGREIIEHVFKALAQPGGERLLPHDFRSIYDASNKKGWKLRTICDFIASMTDRYCVEFYSRLIGINAPSIYKPY